MLSSLIGSGKQAQQSGAWDEALVHYQAALEMMGAQESRADRAEILRLIGRVHRERGQLDRAEEAYRASRQEAEAGRLPDKVAAAMIAQANVALVRGSLDAAAETFLEAREVAQGISDDRLILMADQNLGVIANIRGDTGDALVRYRAALGRLRTLGDPASVIGTLNNIGMASVDLGEWTEAESAFDEAGALARETGNAPLTGLVDLNRAELQLRRQRYAEARESCDAALQVFFRLQSKPNIAEAYKFYGILYRETGQPDHAATHFALALGMAEVCENKLLQAETQMEWALLQLETQPGEAGILHLNRALRIFRELKARREVLDIERRMERLKEVYLPAVGAWGSGLTEARDPHQAGHAGRVARYAAKLATEVGIEGWDLTWLQVGALIHDLGNSAVPDEVLQKLDPLTGEEREIMRVHTIVGHSMAQQLSFPEEVHPIVRHHHEQWAGTGYPDQLAGEEIPLSARIVSIADVWDALTSPRSFRPPFSHAEALRMMEGDAPRMFDPRLFGIFRDILERGDL